jgi:hypothetical protein
MMKNNSIIYKLSNGRVSKLQKEMERLYEAGEIYEKDDGGWYYYDAPYQDEEGPFETPEEAMMKLEFYVKYWINHEHMDV